jgi:hypothetical protein
LAFFDRFLVRLPPNLGFKEAMNVATLNCLPFVRGAIIMGVEDDIFGLWVGLDILILDLGFSGITNLLLLRADFFSAAVAALLGSTFLSLISLILI